MHERLQQAVIRLVSPLVRLLLRHGVSHAEFSSWAKLAYVREAQTNFGVGDKKPTTSRIAVMTGINRKEVKRILELPQAVDAGDAKHNRAARVVTGWLQDSDFSDADGRPKPLAYGDPDQGFNLLVKRYSGDVPARAVLDELTRVGTVARADSTVTLTQSGYVPHESEEAMLDLLGESASDLLHTLDHNLAHPAADARLQLSVVYDNLPAECLNDFRQISRKQSIELLKSLDQYLATHDRDANPDSEGHGRYRAGLGLYLIEHELEPEQSDDQ